MYKERIYRNLFKSTNLNFFDVRILETDLRIGADKDLSKEALSSVKKYRKQIEEYIKICPDFLTSLAPLCVIHDSPPIIQQMCLASQKAGVGPMASVAGAIAQMVGMELLNYSEEIIIENGGDIFIKTNKTRNIGVFAGESPLNLKISVEISPEKTPLGICTSSGTVGHSMSFGKADAAVILASDAFLADSVATATANIIKTADDIENGIKFSSTIEGVQGILIIVGDKMGAWGEVKLAPF